MKVFTSAAPLSQEIKTALAEKRGRDSLLTFINQRAAGDVETHLQLRAGTTVVELTAEPAVSGIRREYPILRDAARGESCVRCGAKDGTVVLCHYSGARRLAYGGGLGAKVHDVVGAHLCAGCHLEMDTLAKDKARRWEVSEEMQHYCLLTVIRLVERGVLCITKKRLTPQV